MIVCDSVSVSVCVSESVLGQTGSSRNFIVDPPDFSWILLPDVGAGKNNKLNFLWPEITRWEPPLLAPKSPEKVYVDPFVALFPRKYLKWGT